MLTCFLADMLPCLPFFLSFLAYMLTCFLTYRYLFSCLPAFLSISFLIFSASCVPYLHVVVRLLVLSGCSFLSPLINFFLFWYHCDCSEPWPYRLHQPDPHQRSQWRRNGQPHGLPGRALSNPVGSKVRSFLAGTRSGSIGSLNLFGFHDLDSDPDSFINKQQN